MSLCCPFVRSGPQRVFQHRPSIANRRKPPRSVVDRATARPAVDCCRDLTSSFACFSNCSGMICVGHKQSVEHLSLSLPGVDSIRFCTRMFFELQRGFDLQLANRMVSALPGCWRGGLGCLAENSALRLWGCVQVPPPPPPPALPPLPPMPPLPLQVEGRGWLGLVGGYVCFGACAGHHVAS